jgi:hypothetical protein
VLGEAVPAPPGLEDQAGSISTRRQRKEAKSELLSADAVSTRHLMTHFPLNAKCMDCAAKLREQAARRRRADPDVDTGIHDFGDLISMDHLLSGGKDVGINGETAGLLIADVATENLHWTAMQRRVAIGCTQALRDFAGATDTIKLVSSDNAAEFVRAVADIAVPHKLGTPYRSTTNGRIENLIGQVRMGARALLHQAGLPPAWWPLACAFYCAAHNIVGKPVMNGVTPYQRRSGEPFPGLIVPFGAGVQALLPETRVPRSKFASRTTLCLFLGYHWNPGQTWSGDYYVSPVDDFGVHGKTSPRVIRIKGGIKLDTSRPWFFPVKTAKVIADRELLVQRQIHEQVHHLPAPGPDMVQGEVDDVDADTAALDAEQQFWSEDDDPPDLDNDPGPDMDVTGIVDESLLGLDAAQRARRLQDDAGIWPPRRGSTRPPNIDPDSWQALSHALRLEVARDYRKKVDADTAPKTQGTQTGAVAVIEICTSPDSTLGQVVTEANDSICRYTASMDFRLRETLDMALADVKRFPGAHIMASIPCTAGSAWQRINLRRGGAKQKARIKALKGDMRILVSHLRLLAVAVRKGGGTISFEWPRACTLWQEPEVKAFITEFQLKKVDFDGCAVGLVSTSGEPLLKPWRIHTDNLSVLRALIDKRCQKKHAHGIIAGRETAKSASYPPELCVLLHKAFTKPERIPTVTPPARFQELAASARTADGQETHAPPSIAPPPGLTLPAGSTPFQESRPDPSFATVWGTPLSNPTLFGIDPTGDTEGSAEVVGYAAVEAHTTLRNISAPSAADGHRTKSKRPEMPLWCGLLTRVIKAGTEEFKSAPCNAAQEAERAKLEQQETWDLTTVREWSAVRSDPALPEATVARLFVIMGRKGDEMADTANTAEVKYKARGVLAGNNIQSKGTPAHELFTEVAQTPASLTSARAALAAGALKGHRGTVRDATTAYLQASLKTHNLDGTAAPTQWVRLPKSWWPKAWFKEDGTPVFYDPVVRLKKALYGHPESEAIWDRHLGDRLKKEGWLPVQNQPGCWYHAATESTLVVYVDDLLMVAAREHEQALWAAIEKHIDFSEPALPIDRYLGAHYIMEKFNDKHGKECMSFSVEMSDFLASACKAYEADVLRISGAANLKLQKADTPYQSEDTAGDSDEPAGLMSKVCASHLMRLLYAARVARPDIQTAIVRLAKHITKWKVRHDRCLQRLFSYVHGSLALRLTGSMPIGQAAHARLVCWPDADLAGDKDSAKATGGFWVELECGDHRWPLAWQSKRQTSTTISTAESETISLQRCLHKEGLPLQEALSNMLGVDLPLLAQEDNSQCIAAVTNGYSANMRQLSRVQRTCISAMHELFYPEVVEDFLTGELDAQPELNCSIIYCPSGDHKGDMFTKPLERAPFIAGLIKIGMML